MSICLRRREFIAALGGATAWPLAAHAQQRALPVIGYLSSRTAESDASLLASVRRGLADVGYAEGRNVAFEYRFADGRYDRLPGQLTDLTQRKVGVIVFAGFVPTVSEAALTSSVPPEKACRSGRSGVHAPSLQYPASYRRRDRVCSAPPARNLDTAQRPCHSDCDGRCRVTCGQ